VYCCLARPLKVALGQFRFHQQAPNPHVNFSAIQTPISERYAPSNPKLRDRVTTQSQQSAHCHRSHRPWVAEHVHQQRVRTRARIQLPPPTVLATRKLPFGRGMYLLQPTPPLRIRHDPLIAGGMKVSVLPATERLEAHRGRLGVAEAVGKAVRPGIRFRALHQFGSKLTSLHATIIRRTKDEIGVSRVRKLAGIRNPLPAISDL